ncbi:MAG: hypothetical protein KDE19_21065 [Caldilineaceae bacterium]|nr:hypothetical protein [Caldilineaceae bacterium]
MTTTQQRLVATEKYKRSLTRAQLADLLSLITGEQTDLISYDEVAKRLHARQQIEAGIQHVPLDCIVGSVGRYRDFTRTFLPRAGANAERWARLDAAMNSLEGFPPVELFKIGEVYFVRDGNHRVSVARANDVSHIEAYVTEVKTDLPLTVSDFDRDEWLIKAESIEFQEKTHLNLLRPDHKVRFTEPGRYELLLQHIEVHRYFRDLELASEGRPGHISWEEAVLSWYDNVYLPMVAAIEKYHLLDHFPNRTEADLYLWVVHHRERLAGHYGLAPLDPDTAVATFAEVHSERPWERTIQELRKSFYRLWPDERPLGMSEEAFQELRKRHDAGELSVDEARLLHQRATSTQDSAEVCVAC